MADPATLQAIPEKQRTLAELVGKRIKARRGQDTSPFASYRFRPADYIAEKLGWTPWNGTDEEPGQMQVLEAYALALQQQWERREYELGNIARDELIRWHPGVLIRNWIRVESGHNLGKTKLSSGITNHFFDCFDPCAIYTMAPGWNQIHDLAWKEIKGDRRGKGLPGQILDMELRLHDHHFAKGRATNNNAETGGERVQGQHEPHMCFILDEAEGIADFVWDAVDNMASGGLVIVVLLANPRTRTSMFHKMGRDQRVASFRISQTWHPNVLLDKELIPGSVRREHVEKMLRDHCQIVPEHSADDQTFEVRWHPGMVYKPDPEAMWRMLGVAPLNTAGNTVIPVGRFESACAREAPPEDPQIARIGVDVALYGNDMGTIYLRHKGTVRRIAQMGQQSPEEYAHVLTTLITDLKAQGVTNVHIRIDVTGVGWSVISALNAIDGDPDFLQGLDEYEKVAVNFSAEPYYTGEFVDLITEAYFATADALNDLRIEDPPEYLEEDLTERTYHHRPLRGRLLRALTPKLIFREQQHRSPDDGDGFVLAAGPDYVFLPHGEPIIVPLDDGYRISPY